MIQSPHEDKDDYITVLGSCVDYCYKKKHRKDKPKGENGYSGIIYIWKVPSYSHRYKRDT